jgi:hypothetical protein
MGLYTNIISNWINNIKYNKLQCGCKFERVSRNILNTYKYITFVIYKAWGFKQNRLSMQFKKTQLLRKAHAFTVIINCDYH